MSAYHFEGTYGSDHALGVRPVTEEAVATTVYITAPKLEYVTDGNKYVYTSQHVSDKGGRIITTIDSPDGNLFYSDNSNLTFVRFTQRDTVLVNVNKGEQSHTAELALNLTRMTARMWRVLPYAFAVADAHQKLIWGVTANNKVCVYNFVDPGTDYFHCELPAECRAHAIVAVSDSAFILTTTADGIMHLHHFIIEYNGKVSPLRRITLDGHQPKLETSTVVQGKGGFVATFVTAENERRFLLVANQDNKPYIIETPLNFVTSKTMQQNIRFMSLVFKKPNLVHICCTLGMQAVTGYGHLEYNMDTRTVAYHMRSMAAPYDNFIINSLFLLDYRHDRVSVEPTQLVHISVTDKFIESQQRSIEVLARTARNTVENELGISYTVGLVAKVRREKEDALAKKELEHAISLQQLKDAHELEIKKLQSANAMTGLSLHDQLDKLKLERDRLVSERDKRPTTKAHDALKQDNAAQRDQLRALQALQASQLDEVDQVRAELREFKAFAAKKEKTLTERLDTQRITLDREHVLSVKRVRDVAEQREQQREQQLRSEFALQMSKMKEAHDLAAIQAALAMENNHKQALTQTIAKITADHQQLLANKDVELHKLQERIRTLEANVQKLSTVTTPAANTTFVYGEPEVPTTDVVTNNDCAHETLTPSTMVQVSEMQQLEVANKALQMRVQELQNVKSVAFDKLQTEIATLRRANTALSQQMLIISSLNHFGFLPNGTSLETALQSMQQLMVFQEDNERLRTELFQLKQLQATNAIAVA